ncbi:plasmid mobilization protein [Streptomyces sp. NBC_01264]|uniref:plasmid mobilization protein n=1 Tax=Streptomyces sp. NBC_01264 TaxID=2903804 RepID=UPI00225560B9|nr:plasmid mobilization relaxosome protein MobC [Streptomyces sp. NBC_01264]MCX4776815.1 MobC family plasmid mobilization relaxosome protein [Streptomyces sp. NBC_01264]
MTDLLSSLPHETYPLPINSTSGRASYPIGYSTVGGVSNGPGPQGSREPSWHRGAPGGETATGGGSQSEEQPHTCHDSACEHVERVQARPRRRPYQRGQRPHVRNARLNDEELAAITAGAHAAGLTVAGFIAHAALAAARDIHKTAAEIASEREVVSELFAARRHLGYIGNNINQIAHILNSGGDTPQTDAALAAVHRAARRLEAVTQQLIER